MEPVADHDRHLMTVALTARLGSGPSPLSVGKFWALAEQLGGDLTRASELADPDIAELSGRRTSAALHLTELEGQSIHVLTPFHDGYPARILERLGTKAPPLLYGAGDIRTATTPSRTIGIVGSRDASETALAFATEVGQRSAEEGWRTVSGGAKGVDAAGLNAAWRSGGFVSAILAEGVRRASRRRSLREVMADGHGAILSPLHPDAGFSVGAAMGRNKLIYALADVTAVAAVSEGNGGTWAGATEALARGFGRVAVHAQAEAAAALVDLGAVPIDSAEEIVGLLQDPAGPDLEEGHVAEQASLF